MRETLLVAQREYLDNLRTKTFWIGILSVPVLLAAGVIVPILLMRAKDARTFAVLDHSGWLLPAVEERMLVSDLERLLDRARDAGTGTDKERQALPPVLRPFAEPLASATDEDGARLAVVIGARGDSLIDVAAVRAKLGAEMLDLAERDGAALRRWLEGLSPEAAAGVDPRLFHARYRRVELQGDHAGAESEARRRLDEGPGRLFAYFIVGQRPEESSEANRYVSNNRTDPDLRATFSRFASEEIEARRFAREGVQRAVAARIQEPVRFEERQLSEGGEEQEVQAKDELRQWAPMGFVYLLWISVFSISNLLLTSTIEEKSNRLMEVLLSSVSPLELMAGKILGIAATGLTMVGSWLLCLLAAVGIGLRAAGPRAPFDASFLLNDPVLLPSFVVYFVLGYLFYAAVMVGIGAACNTLKDAQGFMTPITLIVLVPMFAIFPVTQDPNGTIARVLSFVPPYTPFVMMNRAAGPPATWEYVATTIELLLAVIAALWVAAKVFRVGVLMTGTRPRLSEILRWITAPVGSVPERQ